MDYEFSIHPRAKKELDSAPTDTRNRIRKKIREMVTDEFRELADYDVKQLRGTDNTIYRTRIGDWRIFFATNVDGETTTVGIVGADKRSGAYGNTDVFEERADEF
jgi:mRNA-degrading endonuclease RelE of RelBE toxin-antitoxin system